MRRSGPAGTYEIGDTYKLHPEYFQFTPAQEVALYRNGVNASREITETIVAPYVRCDAKLVRDRLTKVTGLELDYRQNLGFLNPWVRGLNVFGNLTLPHLQGSEMTSSGTARRRRPTRDCCSARTSARSSTSD